MKRCKKCGETKPLSAYYMEKGKPRARCKDCHKAALYARRAEDPDAARALKNDWAARNREKLREADRELWKKRGAKRNAERREQRAQDPETVRAKQRAWRDANIERAREVQRKSRAKHRDVINARLRADYYANHEVRLKAAREYREQNPDAIRERNKRYCAQNPDEMAKHRARRRARQAAVEHIDYTRTEIYERDEGRCRGCHKELENKPHGFQIDHIVPISLGGPDTPANVQLMCAKCNRAKWANLEGQIHLAV